MEKSRFDRNRRSTAEEVRYRWGMSYCLRDEEIRVNCFRPSPPSHKLRTHIVDSRHSRDDFGVLDSDNASTNGFLIGSPTWKMCHRYVRLIIKSRRVCPCAFFSLSSSAQTIVDQRNQGLLVEPTSSQRTLAQVQIFSSSADTQPLCLQGISKIVVCFSIIRDSFDQLNSSVLFFTLPITSGNKIPTLELCHYLTIREVAKTVSIKVSTWKSQSAPGHVEVMERGEIS